MYKKRTGEFFLYGEGGKNSKYAKMVKNNFWEGNDILIPLGYEAAKKWVKEHLTQDDYDRLFGSIDEGTEKKIVSFSLPETLSEKLKRKASESGKTQSDIVAELIKNI